MKIQVVDKIKLVDGIISGSAAIGIGVREEAAQKMAQFTEMLVEWNERMNLTAVRDPLEMVNLHFVDSLSCLLLDNCWDEGSKVIDVGTGAGFPGMPLLLTRPDLQMTFLDSTAKRLGFIKEACSVLGVKAEFLHSRAEDAGKLSDHRETYDIAVSRAVARLNVLAEYCLPLVDVSGSFIAMKGPAVSEELQVAEKAFQLLGGYLTKDVEFTLPTGEGRRIIRVRKAKSTPKAYPRKAGLPSKQPLGE